MRYIKSLFLCLTKFELWLSALTFLVTALFYFILKAFDTPNLLFSMISIAASFAASYITVFRSPVYAVVYAVNDVVLIVLWSCFVGR